MTNAGCQSVFSVGNYSIWCFYRDSQQNDEDCVLPCSVVLKEIGCDDDDDVLVGLGK